MEGRMQFVTKLKILAHTTGICSGICIFATALWFTSPEQQWKYAIVFLIAFVLAAGAYGFSNHPLHTANATDRKAARHAKYLK